MSPLTTAARALIGAYQCCISPFMAPRCRYLPTCSDYAREALAEHGLVAGGSLALRRICRCHPWASSSFDPVHRARGTRAGSAASHAGSQNNGGIT